MRAAGSDSSSPPLILATRESPLALAQTRIVVNALKKLGVRCVIKKMSSRGDDISDRSLADIGGKELFIGRLRRALLEGSADIAVHSLKDIPAAGGDEFANVAVGFAEDPRDIFVSGKYESLAAMPPDATVGTCSPRRIALLREYFPQLKTVPMRGNIQTRLQKMQDGACDGIILAAAGLRRLNLIGNAKDGAADGGELHFEFLPPEVFIPAPGQGMLAAECAARRKGEAAMQNLCAAMHDPAAELRRAAETEFARLIGGDCRTPLGAFAADKDGMRLCAFYADGGKFRRTLAVFARADKDAARAAAREAAKTLLQ